MALYEAPKVVELGSVADFTRGHKPNHSGGPPPWSDAGGSSFTS